MADFVVGDTNIKLVATCLRRDGSFVDLTGLTVQLKWRINGILHPPAQMTILSPATAGRVEYNFQPGDVNLSGIMYTEIEVISGSISVPPIKIISSSVVIEFTVRDKVA